ncbi:MAG: hypothetical protein LBC63_09085 [Holophagales bacterium]|nr:hypothetical protein [Holophagales bacterium]
MTQKTHETMTMEYKGYTAQAEWDDEERMLVGDVVGIDDILFFRGATASEARDALEEIVDAYLESCIEHGDEPCRPGSGKIIRDYTEPSVAKRGPRSRKAARAAKGPWRVMVIKKNGRRLVLHFPDSKDDYVPASIIRRIRSMMEELGDVP